MELNVRGPEMFDYVTGLALVCCSGGVRTRFNWRYVELLDWGT